MKLVVGLGNPGADYRHTRHNVGFDALDRLAERRRFSQEERRYRGTVLEGRIGPEPVILLKPATYMNRSGEAVEAAVTHLGVPLDALLIVHDEIDFPLGTLRVKRGGGDGGHKGIRSIIEELGRDDFARIRIGVGRPDEQSGVVDWVLEGFADEEQQQAKDAIDLASEATEVWLRQGATVAMNRFNRKSPAKPPETPDEHGHHEGGGPDGPGR